MDIDVVLDKLMEAGVAVWLNSEEKLCVDKDAPPHLKDSVREHRQALIDARKAQKIMNRPGMRGIKLPLGQDAVVYPMGADLNEIRWATQVLRMGRVPLVINDEGFKWISYQEWRRQPLCTKADRENYRRQREAEEQEKLKRDRRTA